MPVAFDDSSRLTDAAVLVEHAFGKAARGSGRRAALTATAVAATALVATAAYVWWRRHDAVPGASSPQWMPEPSSPPSPLGAASISVVEREPDEVDPGVFDGPMEPIAGSLETEAATDDEAIALVLDPFEDALVDAEVEEVTRPAEAAPTESAELASAELPESDADADDDAEQEEPAAVAIDEPAVETEDSVADAAAMAPQVEAGAELPTTAEASAGEPAGADLAEEEPAVGTPPHATAETRSADEQRPAMPRTPERRSNLDPSPGGHRPEERIAPRGPFQPQRFTVPSSRPKLPGTRHSPLP
jgi:hypothetical protein